MKTFTFKLGKTSFKRAISDLSKAIKSGVPSVHGDEMTCPSIESMMTVLSRSKFETFAAIVENKPSSLKELADILGKDLGNVSRDVKALELMGLVELQRDQTGKRIRPVAKYEQIAFDFSGHQKKASGAV